MKASDLEPTHSIELEVTLNGKKATLLTSVEVILKNTVLMTPIQLNGKMIGFPPPYTVNFLYPEADLAYCWQNVSIKPVRYQNRLYHSVTLNGDALTINRRGAYRVYIGKKMNILVATSTGSDLHEIHVRDISETGMAFLAKEEFSVGKTVRLQLKVNGGPALSLAAQILWKRDSESRIADYLYGCKFLDRNKFLSSYLMSLQQEQQRKKLGRRHKI